MESGFRAILVAQKHTSHKDKLKVQKVKNIFVTNLVRQSGETLSFLETDINFGKGEVQSIGVFW